MRRLHGDRTRLGRTTISRAVLALSALTGVGCSNALETGYVPRPLGATPTERRGYYASPFTPEAVAAQAQNDPTNDVRSMRKPGGGYRGP